MKKWRFDGHGHHEARKLYMNGEDLRLEPQWKYMEIYGNRGIHEPNMR